MEDDKEEITPGGNYWVTIETDGYKKKTGGKIVLVYWLCDVYLFRSAFSFFILGTCQPFTLFHSLSYNYFKNNNNNMKGNKQNNNNNDDDIHNNNKQAIKQTIKQTISRKVNHYFTGCSIY